MSKRKTIAIWTVLILAILAAASAIALLHRRQPVTLRGAVLRQDRDANRQLPLADVQITAVNTLGSATSKSDSSGFFTLKLPKGLRRRQQVILTFRHEGYQPSGCERFYRRQNLYRAHGSASSGYGRRNHASGSAISNTRIRYSVKGDDRRGRGQRGENFSDRQHGNTPCNNQPPCAPGGKWKATIGSLSLDAGEGNEFRNARVSCIAGPCPFTKIEVENFSPDRRRFNVSVLNWSDTVTFLLEAEVVHPMTSDMVRETYPVIFGRALNFSLPASAEGPSIEAEVQGEADCFSLGT